MGPAEQRQRAVRSRPAVTVVDDSRPAAGADAAGHGWSTAAWVTEAAAGRRPGPAPSTRRAGPGGRGVDQRHHRPAQGRGLRPPLTWPRWPPAPTSSAARGPAAVAAALRPRRLHDPGLGRGSPTASPPSSPPRPWRAAEALRIMADRAHHRGPGRAHPVGAGAGPARARRRRPLARCGSPAPARPGCRPSWWPRCAAGWACPVVVRYTSTETSLGTGTRPEDPDEVVATTVGRPVAGVELRIVGDDGSAGPPARSAGCAPLGRRHARLLGEAGPPGTTARVPAAWSTPRRPPRVRTPDGWVTTGRLRLGIGDDGNLQPGRPGQRALHPRRVQRLPGRGGGPSGVRTRPSTGWRSSAPPTRCWARSGWPSSVARRPGRPAYRPGRAAGAAAPRRLADYKAPDAVVGVAALPLTPMMKVDQRALAAQAARSRRRARRPRLPPPPSRTSLPGARPTDQGDPMSPIKTFRKPRPRTGAPRRRPSRPAASPGRWRW